MIGGRRVGRCGWKISGGFVFSSFCRKVRAFIRMVEELERFVSENMMFVKGWV